MNGTVKFIIRNQREKVSKILAFINHMKVWNDYRVVVFISFP